MMNPQEREARDKWEQFPWCLPAPPKLLQRLALGSPPPLRPGTAPLVAVSDTTNWLGAVVADPTLIPGAQQNGDVGLGPTALQAWNGAWTAMDTVPIRWRSLGLQHLRLQVKKIWLSPVNGQVATASTVLGGSVDGASFGLSFALAQVSWLIGKPLPDDVIASATIGHDGKIGPVGEIDRKITFAVSCGKTLQRFIVAHDQEITAPFFGSLEIVRVATLEQAVAQIWPELAQEWRQLGADPVQRKDMVQRLFHLACGRRVDVRSWYSVANSASEALQHWAEWLSEDEHHRLAFVQAVAKRHESNEGTLTLEHLHWLRGHCHEPIRTELIAHALQQCADAGSPQLSDLDKYFYPIVDKPDLDLQPAELKVLGALARVQAVQRQGEQALVLARRTTEQWRERGDHNNASYPICIWLLTAGLLGQPEQLDQARRVAEWIQQGGVSGSAYLLLALGRGARWLRTPSAWTTARTHLWAILQAQHGQSDAHVRASAARNLLAVEPSFEQKAACLQELGLDASDLAVGSPAATTPFALLAQLDALLLAQVGPEAMRTHVERLQQLSPAICAHVLKDVSDEDMPATLAKWYPY
jgi:hypothetical protein